VLKLPGYLQSVMTAIDDLAQHHPYAGPGGFNDPDMLVVGLDGMTPYGLIDSDDKCPPHLEPGQCKKGDYISREVWGAVGGLTQTEQRTHFAFWCALAAPLMLGNDPRKMSAATRRILMAPELLAINQDPLGQQARRVWHEGSLAIWRKQLASGEVSQMGIEPSVLTTRYSLLTTHYSLLTAHCSLLTTHYSPGRAAPLQRRRRHGRHHGGVDAGRARLRGWARGASAA
jgi:hypothetical protein